MYGGHTHLYDDQVLLKYLVPRRASYILRNRYCNHIGLIIITAVDVEYRQINGHRFFFFLLINCRKTW